VRFAAVSTPDGPCPVLVVNDHAVFLHALDPAMPRNLLEVMALPVERLHRYQQLAAMAVQSATTPDAVVALETACFAPPVTPTKIICLALNYRAHAEEGGFAPPERPVIFLKGPNTVAGHDTQVSVPPLCRQVDHEGELVAVVGRRCRNLTDRTWPDAVAGYTIMNDLTARDLQLADIRAGYPWDLSKNFDGFGPIGPYLVASDEVEDPQALDLEVRVDGELRQKGSTASMIFGVGELLVRLSAVMTLEPGDLIATGTCAGIGPVPDGSIVEVRIGDLGTLRNRIVFERRSS
jgi:5-oxopent-3-ene-1,2,5-tricarboxylate decarboxylase/2-hydroxyhepta-2,4-diene-1,7-dioate isomerase